MAHECPFCGKENDDEKLVKLLRDMLREIQYVNPLGFASMDRVIEHLQQKDEE